MIKKLEKIVEKLEDHNNYYLPCEDASTDLKNIIEEIKSVLEKAKEVKK